MGLGGISVWQLLIVLLIVVLLFGTKKLKTMGSDLGSAVKGFKKAVTDENEKAEKEEEDASTMHKENAGEEKEEEKEKSKSE